MFFLEWMEASGMKTTLRRSSSWRAGWLKDGVLDGQLDYCVY